MEDRVLTPSGNGSARLRSSAQSWSDARTGRSDRDALGGMLDTGPPKLDVDGRGGADDRLGGALLRTSSAYLRSAGGTDSGARVGREAISGSAE
jgi:hypothetical protein